MASLSSVLSTLELKRQLAYSHSSIELVSAVENKYPLSDIIMASSAGERVEGNLEGYGTVEFNDGHTYKGDFHCGVMHGQGRYTWKDGVVYEGEFTNCHITGVGTYRWPDGSVYTGDVSDGFRHGHGTYRTASSGAVYTGQWVWGKREGKGKLVYDKSGEVYYDGDWVDNQQEGRGTRKYRSGNVYEGEWHHNKRHGRGTMHWYDRGERYTGQWVNGIQQGHGEHLWLIKDTDHAQFPLCNHYVGEWRNGQREGQGTFHYASGAVYSGGWHGNKKHGRGRFVFQNGQVFEGVFDSDRMVGGAPQEGEGHLLRPQTPLGSLIGDIDPSNLAAGSATEQFNLHISRLLPPSSPGAGPRGDHELQQVHCVLLHYISELKRIYHCYSALGRERGRQIMTRMQFWRLLKDCKLHHHGFSLLEADTIADPTSHSPDVHDPRGTFLMREFLQALVFLAHHIFHDRPECRGSVASGHLAECLRQFITTLLRPRACKIGGLLYRSPEHSAVAGQYWEQCWTIYQKLWGQTWCGRQSENTVTMRQTLLLLERCGLIGDFLAPRDVVRVMVEDNPLAVDGQDYNLQVEVTFLEFFEVLLLCAEQWYCGLMQQTVCPTVPPAVGGGDREIQCGETADGEGGEARDQPPSESEVPSKDTEEEREVEEDERKEGAEESVPPPEKDQFDQWRSALHTFFTNHLFPQAEAVLHCTY